VKSMLAQLRGFSTQFFWVLVFILAGCAQPTYEPMDDSDSLPRKIDGASDKTRIELQRKLNQKSIRTITIGQGYLINIPAKNLFYLNSPRLTAASYETLQNVVAYLKQYRKVEVHVTAFSSPSLNDDRDRALTRARAKEVAEYLWSQGIDSRFIFDQGLGSEKPISSNCGVGNDTSLNARVEISFRETLV
jgi:intracellular multiplication protein IcmN